MSDFFDSGNTEKMPPPPIKTIRQKNTIIGILIAIIGVLVAILLVKGFDGSDNAVPSVQTVEETSSVPQPIETSPTATEDIAEEPEPAPEEEKVPEPTPLPDDPESLILLADYVWMDPTTSEATIALQELLELEADGWYGMGTRAAHLTALEERGLPTEYAAICDLTVGEEICALQPRQPIDDALVILFAGLGDPDTEVQWEYGCVDQIGGINWGPVRVLFRSFEGGDPVYMGWEIENVYSEDNEWLKPFPAEVNFAESLLVDFSWDAETDDMNRSYWGDYEGLMYEEWLTDIVVPGGALLEPVREDFEENVGHVLRNAGDGYEFDMLYTDKYKVMIMTGEMYPGLEGSVGWTWATSDFSKVCPG
jgi:hypothetical protein